jgi:predicted MFS family arabinose efflux permease
MTTKGLQIQGFIIIAICFVAMAVSFVPLRDSNPQALFFVYCCLLFSLNYGPNITTYILPAETYPKEVRATFNGMSAALGKVGAFTGVYMFGPVVEASSYPVVMTICAFFSVLGAIISYIAIEDKVDRSRDSNNDMSERLLS